MNELLTEIFYRITCYEVIGEDMATLNNLMEMRSDLLRPYAMLQIVHDVTQAIQALHSNNITHSNISTKTILIGIHQQVIVNKLINRYN